MVEGLEERYERYKRVLGDPAFTQTLDEMDDRMGLRQNVFGVLKAEQSEAYIIAKEGARAYSDALRNLVAQTKQALEDVTNQGEIHE